MKKTILHAIVFMIISWVPVKSVAQKLSVTKTGEAYSVSVLDNNKILVSSPAEGLWSIATGWDNGCFFQASLCNVLC